MARTAEVGDETGSAVTAGRLVRDAMRLALLLDRRSAPYQKWLGTAFAETPMTSQCTSPEPFMPRTSKPASPHWRWPTPHWPGGTTTRV